MIWTLDGGRISARFILRVKDLQVECLARLVRAYECERSTEPAETCRICSACGHVADYPSTVAVYGARRVAREGEEEKVVPCPGVVRDGWPCSQMIAAREMARRTVFAPAKHALSRRYRQYFGAAHPVQASSLPSLLSLAPCPSPRPLTTAAYSPPWPSRRNPVKRASTGPTSPSVSAPPS